MSTVVGTERYMAPEQRRPGYGHKVSILKIPVNNPCGLFKTFFQVDIFAFGLLANETCTNELPFHELDHSVAIALAIIQGDRPRQDLHRPEALSTLIRRCWDENPKSRPEFQEVLRELKLIVAGLDEEAQGPPIIAPALPVDVTKESAEAKQIRECITSNFISIRMAIVANVGEIIHGMPSILNNPLNYVDLMVSLQPVELHSHSLLQGDGIIETIRSHSHAYSGFRHWPQALHRVLQRIATTQPHTSHSTHTITLQIRQSMKTLLHVNHPLRF